MNGKPEINTNGPTSGELSHTPESTPQERMNLLEELADFCQTAGEYPTALEYYSQILDLAERASRSGNLLSQTALKMATCLQGTGEYGRALDMLNLALRNTDRKVKPIEAARILIERSHVYMRKGEYGKAHDDAREALGILREKMISPELALVFQVIGHTELRTGKMSAARESYEASLAISRALGDRKMMARCYNNLGLVCKNTGNLDEAVEFHRKALAIARDLGNKLQIGIRLNNLGIVEFKRGNWLAAKEAWEEALKTFLELGNKWEVSLGYLNLAHYYRAVRNWEKAEGLYQSSFETARENDHRRCEALYYEHFGELCMRKRETGRAEKILTEGLEMAGRVCPEGDITAEILRRRGECRVLLEDSDGASDDFRSALMLTRRLGDRFEEGTVLRGIGLLHMQNGDPERAEKSLRRSIRLLKEAGAAYEWGLSVLRLGELAVSFPSVRVEARQLIPGATDTFRAAGALYEEGRIGLVRAELFAADKDGLSAIELIEKIQPMVEEGGTDEEKTRLHEVRMRSDRLLISSSSSESNTLSSFNVLLQRIQSISDAHERLNCALDLLLERTAAERSMLLLRAGESGELEVRDSRKTSPREWHSTVEVARMVIGQSLQNGVKPIFSTSPDRDSRLDTSLAGLARIGSILAIPLKGEEELAGGIYLDRPRGVAPFSQEELDFAMVLSSVVTGILRDLQSEEIRNENLRLRHRLGYGEGFEKIVTQSPNLLKIIETLQKLRESTATILLQGETGTGKELFARAIHHSSVRKDKPFITVNCAELSEDILESELFGHRKGAFTDAKTAKIGLFERASGGTVFIDEIDKASRHFQDTLLRVVDRKEIKQVGSDETTSIDVRIVCAANKNLREEVEDDRFLKDLYYRLRVISIHLPPLRERKEDIPILVEHFLSKHCQRAGKMIPSIRPDATHHLISYEWPGNVRDLEHEVERIVAVTPDGDSIRASDLSPEITQGMTLSEGSTLSEVVERIERQLIREALAKTNGNKSQAARSLGLSRRGFLNKLERYRIR